MKKRKILLLAALAVSSMSAFADGHVDWEKLARQADKSTRLELCYKAVIKQSLDPRECVSKQDACRAVGLSDQDIARTWEEVKLKHEKDTKWDRLAAAAAMKTEAELKAEIDRLTDIDSELKELIFNHPELDVYLDCQMHENQIQGSYQKTFFHKQANGSPRPATFGPSHNTTSVYLKGVRMISPRSSRPFKVEVRAYKRNRNHYQIEVLELNLPFGSVLASSPLAKINNSNPEKQFNAIYSETSGNVVISIDCGLNFE